MPLKLYQCRDCDFTSKSKRTAVLHTISKNWYKIFGRSTRARIKQNLSMISGVLESKQKQDSI